MSVLAFPASSAPSSGARSSGARIAGRATALSAARLRITRRGRAAVSVLVAGSIAVAVAIGAVGAVGASSAAAIGGDGTPGDGAVQFDVHTVLPGESLWSIAGDLDPGADPRDVIVELRRFNGLADSTIQPGQQLAIPPQLAD